MRKALNLSQLDTVQELLEKSKQSSIDDPDSSSMKKMSMIMRHDDSNSSFEIVKDSSHDMFGSKQLT